MKEKKNIVIINIAISFVLLALLFIFKFYVCDKKISQFIYDLSLAIFGGSSLGIVLTLVEYFSEKRKCMEEFYQSAISIEKKLCNLNYLFFDEPLDFVEQLLCERQRNEAYKYFKTIKPSYTAKEKLINEYIDGSIKNEDVSLNENIYNSKLIEYDKRIRDCAITLLEISEVDINELGNRYFAMDFFIINKKVKYTIAYHQIYKTIVDALGEISRIRLDLNTFIESKNGNYQVILPLINRTMNYWYKLVEDSQTRTIYPILWNNLNNSIEKFRCAIYKEKFVEEKLKPYKVIHRNRNALKDNA